MRVTYAPPVLQGTYTQLNAIQVIMADLCAISKEVPEKRESLQSAPAAFGKCQKKPELGKQNRQHLGSAKRNRNLMIEHCSTREYYVVKQVRIINCSLANCIFPRLR